MDKVLQILFQLLPFLNGWFNNPVKKKARLVRKLNRWQKKGKITEEEKQSLLKEMGIEITPAIQTAVRNLESNDRQLPNYS